MIKILQVVNNMDRAGIETMLMNYYRNIDKTQIQFDFLTHQQDQGAYDDEILALGGKIYHAPRLYPQNYIKYFRYMKKFFQEHSEYKIVHSHIDSMSFFPIIAAKCARVPIRIAQSHSTSVDRDYKFLIKKMAQYCLCHSATDYWGCGEEATKFLFGSRIYNSKNYHILHNAVDLISFSYDKRKRNEIRKELAIQEEDFVIGHVGRFIKLKNHKFLINIFKEILRLNSDSKLILVGDGEESDTIRKLVTDEKLQSKVKMLGVRNDVSLLMQAMDVFILPSTYEGLPVVLIEAQASGLFTVVSDAVTSEAKISKDYVKIPLSKTPKEWAKIICDICMKYKRKSNDELIKSSGYEIKSEANKLTIEYMDLVSA